MAAAAADPAEPTELCAYDAPIDPAELENEEFGVPLSQFTFRWTYNGRQHHMILYKTPHGQYLNSNFKSFNPNYFKDNIEKFLKFANDPANLVASQYWLPPQIEVSSFMQWIGEFPLDYECSMLKKISKISKGVLKFDMFCSDSPASKLRMKLFCAFGMLNNFVNDSKIKLMVRGGMALRLQLSTTTKQTDRSAFMADRSAFMATARDADVDGLIIVDPSIGRDKLEKFKTTFMKLLVLSIKSSIPSDTTLICKPASGDSENTIKMLIKSSGGEFELGDFGFKYSHDEIVKIYEKNVSIMTPEGMVDVNGIFPMMVQVYPGFLQCVWNFPRIKNMQKEYIHLVDKLQNEIESIKSIENKTDDNHKTLMKLQRQLRKFQDKMRIASIGGKKRTMKRRTHKRGGSTTEQIGAAAQMRVFLPRHSATRNALNHIVHHESNNRFHDANYRHSPATQAAINKAFRAINANPRVSRRTKKHMKLAKQKASTHRR
jgi:hypothetical protein